MSVKQSIEIETKNHTTLMMGGHASRTIQSPRHTGGTPMAILKHTYKVAITRTNIGYDIVINEFATDGTHREYERRHHAWALTSHGADRAAQRLISRIKRQNQRDEHPREYTIE